LAISAIVLYSYTKRFTWASHFVLGMTLSAAPLGAWIAVRGTFGPEILPLALAVLFWLPGFDILYAVQDVDFDKSQGLYSIPVKFGIRKAMVLSGLLHVLTWGLLLLTGMIFNLGPVYWVGICVVAGLFVYEHSLIRPDDLSRLDMAFFNMNGYISLTVFFSTLLDYLISR
jgi:4-hydroxybenzoate polyprenyltransferase